MTTSTFASANASAVPTVVQAKAGPAVPAPEPACGERIVVRFAPEAQALPDGSVAFTPDPAIDASPVPADGGSVDVTPSSAPESVPLEILPEGGECFSPGVPVDCLSESVPLEIIPVSVQLEILPQGAPVESVVEGPVPADGGTVESTRISVPESEVPTEDTSYYVTFAGTC